MSVHIECVNATYAIATAAPAGEMLPNEPEPLSQPALILSDMDNVYVVIGTKAQLTEIVEQAAKAVAALPD